MKGCELDTDGDGNCPKHRRGCPPEGYWLRVLPSGTEPSPEQMQTLVETYWAVVANQEKHGDPAEILIEWNAEKQWIKAIPFAPGDRPTEPAKT